MKNLKSLLKCWQKRLYLRDWHIEIKLVPQHELATDVRLAEVEYALASKEAIIRISERTDHSEVVNGSIELSLVHELLHLHFVAAQKVIDPESATYVMHEQAINQVARSLVNLSRRISCKRLVIRNYIAPVVCVSAVRFRC